MERWPVDNSSDGSPDRRYRVADGESFVVTVNGRAVADVVPHRPEVSRRQFVPVDQFVEALAAAPVPDQTGWLADLAAAEEDLETDEPTDPFVHGAR